VLYIWAILKALANSAIMMLLMLHSIDIKERLTEHWPVLPAQAAGNS